MKRTLIIVGSIVLVVIVTLFGFRLYTKSHSPFEEVSFEDILSVEYSRPFKKDRLIFGPKNADGTSNALVPYDMVWRTGANEATVFTAEKKILFGGEELEPGSYSLWTIPNIDEWTVILNSEIGQWGVDFDAVANRRADNDVITIQTPVIHSKKSFEQFTMMIERIHGELELALSWDQIQIVVPITITE